MVGAWTKLIVAFNVFPNCVIFVIIMHDYMEITVLLHTVVVKTGWKVLMQWNLMELLSVQKISGILVKHGSKFS